MRWEYQIVDLRRAYGVDTNDILSIEQYFDKMGRDRWELIHVIDGDRKWAYFKRRLFIGTHPRGLTDNEELDI